MIDWHMLHGVSPALWESNVAHCIAEVRLVAHLALNDPNMLQLSTSALPTICDWRNVQKASMAKHLMRRLQHGW